MKQPIDEFDAFELLQVIDPETFTDERYDDSSWEDEVLSRYEVGVEEFCTIVGDLLNCTPVIKSGLSGTYYHALGESDHSRGIFRAAVKREARS